MIPIINLYILWVMGDIWWEVENFVLWLWLLMFGGQDHSLALLTLYLDVRIAILWPVCFWHLQWENGHFPIACETIRSLLISFRLSFPCATYKLPLFLIVLYIIEEIYFTPGSYTESSNTCLVVISLSFLIVQLEVMCEVLKMVL